jgi:16S rRNA (cytosine967-C5)-methyltransferase
MAELADGKAEITATDFSEDRLNLVEENVARLGTPGVSIVRLEEVLQSNQLYHAVLVDAPCSGMGTVRRNPEIRYRITSELLARQAARQMEVLRQAASFVRPGGRLIYSTCSISDVENRDVIKAFLRDSTSFQIHGDPVHTWPDHAELDGFEAVILTRAD